MFANSSRAAADNFVGNLGTQTFTLTMQLDTTPPTVKLSTPKDKQKITEPIAIIGTVDDADSDTVTYTLSVTPVALPGADGRAPAVFASGSSEIVNGVLGQFDPTLWPNGSYEITLTGVDGNNNRASVSRTVTVEGNLKPGSFNLSFKDLELNTPGVPITVTRNYSTLHAADSLDFGHGWSLELGRPKVQVTYPDTRQTLFEGDDVPFRDGTRVQVTLPDGQIVIRQCHSAVQNQPYIGRFDRTNPDIPFTSPLQITILSISSSEISSFRRS
ncbi:MAG: hypothetical protein HZA46_05135 [Planctomycetales bacterium]|nr:hypothetical protein [Planctomycetales bacterium]